MNEPKDPHIEEKQFELAFDELAGRAAPPDRTQEILARARRGDRVAAPPPPRAAASRILVAALVLLGLTVTIVAAILTESRGAPPREPSDGQAKVVVGPTPRAPQDPSAPGSGEPAANELPKGTDPADLKVLRSAEQMLAAEQRLAEWIEQGKIAGVDRVLRFGQLGDWKYREGLDGLPADVRSLSGQRVLMLGFMLPIDEVQGMREFLLVESLWSCCYGTPPDVNGIVRCVMPKGKEVDYQFEPLKLVGTFNVEATIMDGYCVDIYQLDVEFLEVLR